VVGLREFARSGARGFALREGLFVAIVGPSGAGKDTLLKAAAEALSHRPDIIFVRRVITRTSDGVSEDHDTLTPQAFEAARTAGLFCLSWRAHGLLYGLPHSALDAVRRGDAVVANVSRTVLVDAVQTFDRLAVVEITADPEVLVERIAARGRESEEDARERVARSVTLRVPPTACSYVQINNSGPMEIARERLVRSLVSMSL
jgi:ribose 1,5-bisphosphokinase